MYFFVLFQFPDKRFTDFDFSDRELYVYIDAIANATVEDLEERLKTMLDTEKTTLSVIKND